MEIVNLRRVNKFYKRHKLNVSCCLQDFVEYREIDNQIVAAFIIRRYENNDGCLNLLRSLFVDPQHRKKGIASSCLKAGLKKQLETVYLLCDVELQAYYLELGFQSVCDSDLKSRIKLPLVLQKEVKKRLKLMCFRPSNNNG